MSNNKTENDSNTIINKGATTDKIKSVYNGGTENKENGKNKITSQ